MLAHIGQLKYVSSWNATVQEARCGVQLRQGESSGLHVPKSACLQTEA